MFQGIGSSPSADWRKAAARMTRALIPALLAGGRGAIAAAGGHHILLAGPVGAGKTLLARRLPSILPRPSAAEILETSTIFSVAGLARDGRIRTRPFRAPHHTVSPAGLAGGGAGVRPGEASLAHNGVLLADELTDFAKAAIGALTEALETGHVTIARARPVSMPARFQFVGAVTFCPCGRREDGFSDCRCSRDQVRRHFEGISDRFAARLDIRVCVAPLTAEERAETCLESSAAIRERVTLGARPAVRAVR